MSKPADLIGKIFGRLTVKKRGQSDKRGRTRWVCECDCGAAALITGSNLIQGASKSCGCVTRKKASEKALKANYKHGHAARGAQSSEYVSWASMWARCTYKCVKSSEHYLGRGISVCERWEKFDLFLSDMGRKPSPKHTIERIDNDGNYEPGNCKWATRKEQALNKRPR